MASPQGKPSNGAQQINFGTASREEMVEFVKKLNAKLKDTQAQLAQASQHEKMVTEELEAQVQCLTQQSTLLKEQLNESKKKQKQMQSQQSSSNYDDLSSAMEPLQQQIALLSEKVATDEETIADLIEQLEAARSRNAGSSGTGDTPLKAPVATANGNSGPSSRSSTPGGYMDTNRKRTSSLGGGGAPRGDEVTVQRISELETAVEELTTTNQFYASVVSQQDADEKTKAKEIQELKSKVADLEKERDSCSKCSRLSDEVSDLNQQHAELQEQFRKLREASWTLKKNAHQDQHELQSLKDKLRHQEQEMIAANAAAKELLEEQRQKHAAALASASAQAAHHHSSDVRNTSMTGSTSDAASTAPSAQAHSPSARREPQQAVIIPASAMSTPGSAAISAGGGRQPAMTNLPVVPTIRNPTKREKQLLERMEVFDQQLKQWVAYEQARQRNIDEVDRNRAEMFLSMNKELEDKKKEVSELRSKLRAASSANHSGVPSRTASHADLDQHAAFAQQPPSQGVVRRQGTEPYQAPEEDRQQPTNAGSSSQAHNSDALEEAHGKLREELFEVASQRDLLMLQVSQLESELDELKRKDGDANEELRQDLANAKETIQTLVAEKKEREGKINMIIEKVKELKQKESSATAEADQLRALAQQQSERVQQLEQQLGSAGNEVGHQLEKAREEALAQARAEVDQELRALEDEINTWKAKYTAYKANESARHMEANLRQQQHQDHAETSSQVEAAAAGEDLDLFEELFRASAAGAPVQPAVASPATTSNPNSQQQAMPSSRHQSNSALTALDDWSPAPAQKQPAQSTPTPSGSSGQAQASPDGFDFFGQPTHTSSSNDVPPPSLSLHQHQHGSNGSLPRHGSNGSIGGAASVSSAAHTPKSSVPFTFE